MPGKTKGLITLSRFHFLPPVCDNFVPSLGKKKFKVHHLSKFLRLLTLLNLPVLVSLCHESTSILVVHFLMGVVEAANRVGNLVKPDWLPG